jgi:ABC-2 type transport system ATP-binding protein
MTTIAVESLTKRYGTTTVLDEVSFEAPPGSVTGFFGANGAGKSTTLRLLLGLSAAAGGRATIGGQPYRELRDPVRTVGAVLEHSPFHPRRSARDALRVLTIAAGLPSSRVGEVLEMVHLDDVARAHVGRFSLGMRQRLALAAALLGDPRVLILDEPTNGLDPAGLSWIRGWLREQAADGRTVLLSSHLLAEMAGCVDRAVVIAAGRITFTGTMAELRPGAADLLVRAERRDELLDRLCRAGLSAAPEGEALIRVRDAAPGRVGAIAAEHNLPLLELRTDERSVEGVLAPFLAGSASLTRQDAARSIAEEQTACVA